MSAFWERRSPDLPACGLWRGSRGGPAWPIPTSASSRPSPGAKPRGADDRRPPQARPRQVGSRGGGEIKARSTSRGAHDASHDDHGRWTGTSRVVSFFPLWCKGSKRRREHQAKASILVQQDQDQSNGRMEVTVEPKSASPPEPLTGEDQL